MEKKSTGFATASLVLGIVGLCLAFIPIVNYVSLLLGLLAAVFGIVALCRKAGVGKAVAGLVLGLAALAYTVVSLVVLGAAIDGVNDAVNDLNDSLSDISGDNTEKLLADTLDVTFGKFTSNGNEYFEQGELPVTLKNKGTEVKSFSVQIEAITEDGSRITTDTLYISNLNAGQSQEQKAFTLVSGDTLDQLKDATFRVQSVSAY